MKKMRLVLILFISQILSSNIVLADSIDWNVISRAEPTRYCNWIGKVTLEIAYEVLSEGTKSIVILKKEGSNRYVQAARRSVPRGRGVTQMSFDAGGCTKSIEVNLM